MNDFIRIEEAAALLGKSTRTIRRMVKAGKLPAYANEQERGFRVRRGEVLALTQMRRIN